MKPDQAHRLANACEKIVNERLNITARDMFFCLVKNRDLARDVPVTMPSVSRSLRMLVKSKRVRLVRKQNTAYYCVLNVATTVDLLVDKPKQKRSIENVT